MASWRRALEILARNLPLPGSPAPDEMEELKEAIRAWMGLKKAGPPPRITSEHWKRILECAEVFPKAAKAEPALGEDEPAPREDSTAPATAAPAPPACSSSCPFTREAAVLAPGDITAAATIRKALLLHGLPLLAVPFLPAPLATPVALSSLATPVRAGRLSNATCPVHDREHATCTVYRTQPFAGLRKVCHAGSDERALSGPCYCRVRILELEEGPERINFRVLPGHQTPICDPDAVVASGGDVCYVELEGRDYREGYYIRCPVRKCPSLPFLCCPEFPHAAAVLAAD